MKTELKKVHKIFPGIRMLSFLLTVVILSGMLPTDAIAGEMMDRVIANMDYIIKLSGCADNAASYHEGMQLSENLNAGQFSQYLYSLLNERMDPLLKEMEDLQVYGSYFSASNQATDDELKNFVWQLRSLQDDIDSTYTILEESRQYIYTQTVNLQEGIYTDYHTQETIAYEIKQRVKKINDIMQSIIENYSVWEEQLENCEVIAGISEGESDHESSDLVQRIIRLETDQMIQTRKIAEQLTREENNANSDPAFDVTVVSVNDIGFVVRDENNNPIKGAVIKVYNTAEKTSTPFATVTTQEKGQAVVNIKSLRYDGNYINIGYEISANGYHTHYSAGNIHRGADIFEHKLKKNDGEGAYLAGMSINGHDAMWDETTLYITEKNDAKQKITLYVYNEDGNIAKSGIDVSVHYNNSDSKETVLSAKYTNGTYQTEDELCQKLKADSSCAMTVNIDSRKEMTTVKTQKAAMPEPKAFDGPTLLKTLLSSNMTVKISSEIPFLKNSLLDTTLPTSRIHAFVDVSGKWMVGFGAIEELSLLDSLTKEDWKTSDQRFIEKETERVAEATGKDEDEARNDVLNAHGNAKKKLFLGGSDIWLSFELVVSGNMENTKGSIMGTLIGGYKGNWSWNFVFPTPAIPMVATLGYKTGVGVAFGVNYLAKTKFDDSGKPYLDPSSTSFKACVRLLLNISFSASIGIGASYASFSVFTIGISGAMAFSLTMPLIGDKKDDGSYSGVAFTFGGSLNVFVKLLFFKWTLPIVEGGVNFANGKGKWNGKILGKKIKNVLVEEDEESEIGIPADKDAESVSIQEVASLNLEPVKTVSATASMDSEHYSLCNTVMFDDGETENESIIYVTTDERNNRILNLCGKRVLDNEHTPQWNNKEFVIFKNLPGDPLKLSICKSDELIKYNTRHAAMKVYVNVLLYTYVTRWEEKEVESDIPSVQTMQQVPAETETLIFFLATESRDYCEDEHDISTPVHVLPITCDNDCKNTVNYLKSSLIKENGGSSGAYSQIESMFDYVLYAPVKTLKEIDNDGIEREHKEPVIMDFKVVTMIEADKDAYTVLWQYGPEKDGQRIDLYKSENGKPKKIVFGRFYHSKSFVGFADYRLESANDPAKRDEYVLKREEYEFKATELEPWESDDLRTTAVAEDKGNIIDFAPVDTNSDWKLLYCCYLKVVRDTDNDKKTYLFSASDVENKRYHGEITVTDHDIVVNTTKLESQVTGIFGNQAIWWLQYDSSSDGKETYPRLMACAVDPQNNTVTSPYTVLIAEDAVKASDTIRDQNAHTITNPYIISTGDGNTELILPSVWSNKNLELENLKNQYHTVSVVQGRKNLNVDIVGLAPTSPLVSAGRSGRVSFTLNNLGNVPLGGVQLTFYVMNDGKEQKISSCIIDFKNPSQSMTYAFDEDGRCAVVENGETGVFRVNGILDTENGDLHAVRTKTFDYGDDPEGPGKENEIKSKANVLIPQSVETWVASYNVPIDWSGDKKIYMRTEGMVFLTDMVDIYENDDASTDNDNLPAYYVAVSYDNDNVQPEALPCGTVSDFMNFLSLDENGETVISGISDKSLTDEEKTAITSLEVEGDSAVWQATVSELRTDYRLFEQNGQEYITFTVTCEGETGNIAERGVTISAWTDSEDSLSYKHTFRTRLTPDVGYNLTLPVSVLTGGKSSDYLYLTVSDNTDGNEELTDINNTRTFCLNEALKFTKNIFDKKITAGKKAVFSVEVAGGTAPYSYEWAYCLPGTKGKWVKIESADSSIMTIDKVTKEMQGIAVCCRVTDANGERIISDIAVLTVLEPPDTGDHTELYGWMLLLTLSLCAMLILEVRRRRKCNK